MTPLEKVLSNQPYPCFMLARVPVALNNRMSITDAHEGKDHDL